MPQVDVELRGAPWELLERLSGAPPYPTEVLLDGPAGTGKSMGASHLLYWMAHRYPGCRLLAVRKTRASLTESFCVTWEKTIPQGDECLEGPARTGRHSYKWSNGSELVLGGLDQPTRLYSTEWDVVFPEEWGELTEDESERFLRSLRNGRCPFQLIFGNTNPYYPTHWLNRRFAPNDRGVIEGKRLRLYSRHEDNPALFDGSTWTEYGTRYLATLDGLTGVRKERLRYGRWVAAEGLIWPQYDPAVHLVSANLRWDNGLAYLDVAGKVDPVELVWFCASVDWGYTAPGCMQVWGVTADKDAYRVAEIYRTGQTLDWWADRAAELHKEFRLRGIPCDPSRPEAIEKFNDRLGSRGGREAPRIAFAANNRLSTTAQGDLGGLDQVRWALAPGEGKKPKMYFVRNALRFGPDPALVAQSKPTCFEEEAPAYVLLKAAPGNEDDPRYAKDERPDPTCDEHACDTTRYAAQYVWQHKFTVQPKEETFKPGTYGHMFGTPRSLAREERKREREG